jgi:hypothetical protein
MITGYQKIARDIDLIQKEVCKMILNLQDISKEALRQAELEKELTSQICSLKLDKQMIQSQITKMVDERNLYKRKYDELCGK